MIKSKTLASLLFILLFNIIIPITISASEICKARIDCPANSGTTGDTVKVANNVVMLSEIFEHCSPVIVDEGSDSTKDTISMFFVIDHSSSMSYFDTNAVRYKVVQQLIDSIYHYSPASEIGMAVFSNKLLHNYKDDPFYERLYDSLDWNDSYIPLTRLYTQINGVNATEKLKSAIDLSDTERDFGGNLKLINANYDNSGRGRGYVGKTDITLGFEAAKKAFQTATYSKKRQFIVFFSDGDAQGVDEVRAPDSAAYYKDDREGFPTTFTAFFTIKSGTPIPFQIVDMTEHIKNNNYSTKNKFSAVWKQRSDQNDIFTKLLNRTRHCKEHNKSASKT